MSGPQWMDRFTSERHVAAKVASGNRDLGIITVRRAAGPELYRWDVGTSELRSLGVPTDGFDRSWWLAPDGTALYHLVDRDGSEFGHVERLDINHQYRQDLTPKLPPYTLRGGDASLDGRYVALVAVNDDGFQLVAVDVSADPPAPREVYCTPNEMWDCLLSADGSLVAVATTDHNPGTRRFAVTVFETATGRVVNRLHADGTGSVKGIRFAPVPGDARILAESRRARDGFTEPLIWNARTDEREDLQIAAQDCDLIPLDWSTNATLLLAREALATQTLLRYDLCTRRHEQLPLPPGSYRRPMVTASMFGSGESVLAVRETADAPQTVLRWEPGAVPEVALASPAVPPGRPYTSVTFESGDGTPVQAWLAVPPVPGPFPTVVHVHGGPHWHMVDQFSPVAQAWVDHGYAYLDLNVRGSTGRGARYAEQIWGDIGRLELDDLAAAHGWLRENGIALSSAIFLSGESYGGYLTLYGLGRQPDLWAGGICQVAVADWTLAHQDCSAALRAAIAGWFGGAPDAKPDLYHDRSAIAHVATVRAPVLVRQGRHDSRAPARQMREYERRMRELGKRIEVHWFDSGHGQPGATDEVAYMERSIAFAEAIRAATTPAG